MALLIKLEGLKDSVGNEIHVDSNNHNSGVLVRFIPKGEFEGLNQEYTLAYYVSITNNLQKWSSTNIYYDDNGEYKPLVTQFVKKIANFQEIIATYDMLAQQMQGQHPCVITAYGYHYYIKQKLEEVLGANTVVIRLDLM